MWDEGKGPDRDAEETLTRFSVALLMTVVLVGSGCDRAEVRPRNRDRYETVDLERALRVLPSNGAVAILRTEAGIERGAVGETLSGRPAAPDDRFDIGSTSKTFVATVVLQLVGEGRLSLEDTLGELLPREAKERSTPGEAGDARRITVRQLLNHSSGLSGGRVLFAPGTQHSYSNDNFGLLEGIVKNVTGRALGPVVFDRILRPLGLDHTTFGRAGVIPPKKGPWLGARPLEAGGLISTADDVATFFAALLGGRLLSPDLLPQMTQTIEGAVGFRAGLGIFEVALACGTAWGHGGELPTYSTMPLASRDGSKVVVVAQNLGGWTAARAVAEDIYCS